MQDRGPVVLTVTISMFTISTAFVALRLIARFGIVKRISKDDYAMILAWLIALGFSFSICYATTVGLGERDDESATDHVGALRRAEYVFSVLYNPALMATKSSICFFYLSLSRNQHIFKWATIITFALVNCAGGALTLMSVFQCRPLTAAFSEQRPADARCIDIVTLYLSSAPVNIVTDLALLVLPMPVLTSMRLPRNEKIILIITFSFGLFVAVVDVVRIAYLESAATARMQQQLYSRLHPFTTDADDGEGNYSFIIAFGFMWSAIEVHVGMICACVPGVKPLAARFFPKLLGRIRAVGESQLNTSASGGSRRASVFRRISNIAIQPSPDPPLSPSTLVAPGTPPTRTDSVVSATQCLNASMLINNIAQNHDENNMQHDQLRHNQHHSEELSDDEDLHSNARFRQSVMRESVRPSTLHRPRTSSPTLFEFVRMQSTKSMIGMTNRESIPHIAFVTILFFIWGFAYGLVDVLNAQFRLVVSVSTSQTIGLHSAYMGAYFVAPLTFGQYVLRRWGFKVSFIVGLCVYAVGTLIFWPSAVLASFPAFLISNFIMGLGVATLEVASNPFIALCGPPEYAEIRLNISQGVQAIGGVVSPILAKKILFRKVQDAPSLIQAQWTYLGIAFFDVALALAFYYMPLPEASDPELDALAFKEEEEENKESEDQASKAACSDSRPLIPFLDVSWQRFMPSWRTTTITLAFGTISQFCYVGAQEATAALFQTYVKDSVHHPHPSPFDFQSIAHAAFALGRFLTAFLGFLTAFRPRHLLLSLYLGAIVSAVLATILSGHAGIAMLILILFFESGIFSLIFAISIRGLGRRTKSGAAYLTASISGGAVIPPIMAAVASSRSTQFSYCVTAAVFAAGASLPLYLEFSRKAKKQVDPVKTQRSEQSSISPYTSFGQIRASSQDVREKNNQSSTTSHRLKIDRLRRLIQPTIHEGQDIPHK